MGLARHSRRGVAIISAFLLASSAGVGAAVAAPEAPSEEEIERSWQRVDDTAGQIAHLEVQLASNAADVEVAQQDAAIATDLYNQAAVDLEEAEAEAETAAADAERADAEVLAASQEVARLATAAYRDNAGLGHLEMVVTANGVGDMPYRAQVGRAAGRYGAAGIGVA